MMEKRSVYADNAASTPLSESALNAMLPFLREDYANPSQPYSFARNAKRIIRESKEIIADCIGIESPDEIFFTSGGTESDNWALRCNGRKSIVTSSIEHHAVLNTCLSLEQQGYLVNRLPVDDSGIVQPNILADKIVRDAFVSIMMANNEIGSIQPIIELSAIVHENNCIFHTDAVQAVGHIPINVCEMGIDMLSASAHKFNGPKGIGFLYIKKGITITPFISGGAQQQGMRAGTENVAAIIGMATALKENIEGMDANIQKLKSMEYALLHQLNDSGIEFHRNGINHVPGNLSLSFPNYSAEAILHRLDLAGICISTGSACDSQQTQISHVLKAINLDENKAKGTIRVSLGKNNTLEDVTYLSNMIKQIVSQ